VLRELEQLERSLAPSLTQAIPTDPIPPWGARPRVGFLSAHFRWHSVGRLVHGVIAGLSEQGLEVLLVYPGGAVREVRDGSADVGVVVHILLRSVMVMGTFEADRSERQVVRD
jgi:hypothetical protein